MLISAAAFNADAAVHTENVTTQASSGQKVSAWAKVDSRNSVVEAGVTIPYEIIETPPSELGKGRAGSIVVLPFPEIVKNSTFLNHFELNWEMHRHDPKVFMVTRDRMLENKDITYDIPVPGYLGISTRYPTKVDIRYDSKAKAYQVIFSGFQTIVL
ncbi:MAG: hypothetical protein WCF40_10050 [Desulfobacterales bacterium]|jgi:hypothetical protein